MKLSKDDDDFLLRMHGYLKDAPLEPGSRFYEPTHQVLGEDDPVWLMKREIQFGGAESLQLFSGFRGAGKTTELFRLRHDLTEQGYLVLYADALDYVNPSRPVSIEDLLLIVAGAFGDALYALPPEADQPAIDIERESFWDRITSFVSRTQVRLTGIDASATYSSPGQIVIGGIKAGLKIKAELQTESTFRQNLTTLLSQHLVELKAEADAFFAEGRKHIEKRYGKDKKIVFIFDSLEQLRGDYRTWEDVIRSVQQVFTVHLDRLRLPYMHAVYAVPPWLKFLSPTEVPMTVLPTVKLWQNEPDRPPYEKGWEVFHAIVRRRLAEDGIARLFGPNGAAKDGPVDRLIGASGGHVRDLLRMLQEAIKRAVDLPITDRVIENVVNNARRDMKLPRFRGVFDGFRGYGSVTRTSIAASYVIGDR